MKIWKSTATRGDYRTAGEYRERYKQERYHMDEQKSRDHIDDYISKCKQFDKVNIKPFDKNIWQGTGKSGTIYTITLEEVEVIE